MQVSADVHSATGVHGWHVPPLKKLPSVHEVHSFAVGPLQVAHEGSQTGLADVAMADARTRLRLRLRSTARALGTDRCSSIDPTHVQEILRDGGDRLSSVAHRAARCPVTAAAAAIGWADTFPPGRAWRSAGDALAFEGASRAENLGEVFGRGGGGRVVPHSVQKRGSARLSWSQNAQRIAGVLAWGDYHARRERRNAARPGTVGQPGIRRSGHFGRKRDEIGGRIASICARISCPL
jgi:hypothetical protein